MKSLLIQIDGRLLLIGVLLLGLCSCADSRREQPVVLDGRIDLSDWNFDTDGIVELKGSWRFAWDVFVEPLPGEVIRQRIKQTIEVPAGMWHTQPHPDKPGEFLPGQGHGTYLLEVLLPTMVSGQELALSGRNQGGAVRWFVLDASDAEILATGSQGKPAEQFDDAIHVQFRPLIDFRPEQANRILLLAHMSNHDWARGGIWLTPHLATEDQLRRDKATASLIDATIFGICLIIALYHLILFTQRRDELSALYFAALCAAIAIRQLLTGRFFEELGFGFSRDGFDTLMSWEWASMTLSVVAASLFIHSLVPHPVFLRFVQIVCVRGGLLVSFLLIVIPPRIFSEYTALVQFFSLGAGLMLLAYLLYQSLKGQVIARWLLVSVGLTVLGGVNDLLTARAIIDTPYILPYTFVACILTQSAILSGRAAFIHRRIQDLTENLQREVALQTKGLEVKTIEAQEATLVAVRAKEEAEVLRKAAERHSEELEILDQEKTAFFQNMSHELRTPLTLILNPLEAESRDQPENTNLVVATKNSRRLLRLVNQLLDFQKLEAGKEELNLAPLDLNRFAYVCGDYFYSACSTKGVDFSVHRDGQVLKRDGDPIWMMGEVNALEKVAFNYLSNALKYTPKDGSIELGLTRVEDRIRLFVKDSGAGISPEDQGKLFRVFSQVDGTTTRAYEGTGLGLALVKSLVTEMHGDVGVDSALGDGSVFWAEFPVCDPPQQTEELEFEVKSWLLDQSHGETGNDEIGLLNTVGDSGPGSSELVLVVDDLADMRDLITKSLLRRNYRVATAPNGKRGVEIAKKMKPSLIITDWMMPLMSGPELIDELKHDDALNSVPIILLTAKSDEESKLIGTEIGADSFLGKPFNDQELCSIVKNLLSLKSREREVEKLNHMLTENVLKRYLPPDLVEDIVNGDFDFVVEPKRRLVTVLFSDLCGFTRLGERLSADEYASQLNEYLTLMNEIVFANYGTVDKFIGDAIMVMFGAPQDMDAFTQAQRAVSCARAMQHGLGSLNETWQARGLPPLKQRIGIHQGDVVVGNFGSDRRSDYTCIGTAVNLASRIETICSPGSVYTSSVIHEFVPDEVTLVGRFKLKGIEEEQELFELI